MLSAFLSKETQSLLTEQTAVKKNQIKMTLSRVNFGKINNPLFQKKSAINIS